MHDVTTDWWLRLPGDKRVRITAGGVLIGRSSQCDLVLADGRASRAQAIVYAGARGPRLAMLGKGSTSVNAEPVEHERDLAAGDRIELPGLALEVVAGPQTSRAGVAPTTWVLESSKSGVFGVARTPFAVGGGAADLLVDGWPAVVMRFHSGERLRVEAVEPISVDDVELEPGELEVIGPGTVIAYRDERMTVIAGGAMREASTMSGSLDTSDALPERARIDFLPRGGRLIVTIRGRESNVYLADRRCDLVATLLQPPAPYTAGDFVSDDLLLPRVWPGQVKGRVDLNVLIHRTRRDLARAELDGAALLVRAPGGNATRFGLAHGAEVTLA